jgi:hypothetical protein
VNTKNFGAIIKHHWLVMLNGLKDYLMLAGKLGGWLLLGQIITVASGCPNSGACHTTDKKLESELPWQSAWCGQETPEGPSFPSPPSVVVRSPLARAPHMHAWPRLRRTLPLMWWLHTKVTQMACATVPLDLDCRADWHAARVARPSVFLLRKYVTA